jgi:hypothetical protein
MRQFDDIPASVFAVIAVGLAFAAVAAAFANQWIALAALGLGSAYFVGSAIVRSRG